jgi:TonB family protein
MKYVAIILVCALLAACNTIPDYTGPIRSDVLYFSDTPGGRKAAADVTRLYEGKQEVVIVAQHLPEIRHPVPIFRALPKYPPELAAAGVRGEVLVSFVVGETGEVLYTAVVKSSDTRLNAAAIEEVQKWRFAPAQLGGKAVRCLLQIPAMFSLEN